MGGEVRVEILTAYPERLDLHPYLFLARAGSPEPQQLRKVERLRQGKRVLLLKLEGCNDREAADQLRDLLVQIPIEDAVPLENGEYYLHQLIGVVVETDEGEELGEVVDVLETGANDVYVVRGPSGELLVPAIGDVVQELDLEARRLVIRLLPGLRAEKC